MTQPDSERREHPRVPGQAGLRLRAGTRECAILDISCSGIRFMTEEPPPLMSLVDIHLAIPGGAHPPDARR